MTRHSPWLACRARRPDAAVRLYCFPHSGGSAGEYVRWADQLPEIEVWGVQLPGRGSRSGETPFTRMRPLVDALVEEVSFRAPFAFFGHSLGALVAFEVARALRERGREQPGWLFLSAYRAPHLPRRVAPKSHLDDEQLLDALERTYGGMAAELREDPEMRELILPGLRADIELVESARHEVGAPLDCPMTGIGGAEDDACLPEELEPWRAHTTGSFDLRVLPGGHFYLREKEARDTLLRLLGDTLRRIDERTWSS